MVYAMIDKDTTLAVDGESVFCRSKMIDIEDICHHVVASFNQDAVIGFWIDKYKVLSTAQS